MSDTVPVTQADRDRAASTIHEDGSHSSYMMRVSILEANADDWPLVQAFARHRIAHEPAPSPNNDLRTTLFKSCSYTVGRDADGKSMTLTFSSRADRDAFGEAYIAALVRVAISAHEPAPSPNALPEEVRAAAVAIRAALYRACPEMPSYPVGVVEPILAHLTRASKPALDREAFKAAMVDAARARGGAGAQFIADGHTNLWLDIAYDAILALTGDAQ